MGASLFSQNSNTKVFISFFSGSITTAITITINYVLRLSYTLTPQILWRRSNIFKFKETTTHFGDGVQLIKEKHTWRSEEHTSELQSHSDLVCRLLLEKKKNNHKHAI